ncbi:hypothetical protein MMC18_009074 [Xylographa bjoerkii]|nr:hypothetical protein [Xylographa bjoerkii]
MNDIMAKTSSEQEDNVPHLEEEDKYRRGLVLNAVDTATMSGNTGMDDFDAQTWLRYSVSAEQNIDVLEQQWAEILPAPSINAALGSRSVHNVYEMLAQSKQMTHLVRLIKEQPDLVSLLNDATTNHTIWAPTNTAFEELFQNHKALSSSHIRELLLHHIAPHFMPVRRILVTPNVPVLLSPSSLNGAAFALTALTKRVEC